MRRITNLFIIGLLFTSLNFLSISVFGLSVKNSNSANASLSAEQIKQAAESGDPDAQYALGYMFYYGKGGLGKNVAEAKKWITKAADNKQPQAVRAQKLMLAAEQKTEPYQVATNTTTNVSSSIQTKPQMQTSYPAHNEVISNHASNLDKKPTMQREKEFEKAVASEAARKPKIAASSSSEETLTVAHNENVSSSHVNSSEKRLLAVPSNFYTVQLLAGENKDAVDRMMLKNDLKPKAAVYHTYRNAKLMYVLIYGEYKTRAQANIVAEQLHKKLKVEPWVKSYACVKKSMTADNE